MGRWHLTGWSVSRARPFSRRQFNARQYLCCDISAWIGFGGALVSCIKRPELIDVVFFRSYLFGTRIIFGLTTPSTTQFIYSLSKNGTNKFHAMSLINNITKKKEKKKGHLLSQLYFILTLYHFLSCTCIYHEIECIII